MKTIRPAIFALLCSTLSPAQEVKPSSQEELEKAFIERMTAVTMSGTWSSLKDGVVGEARHDKYEIVGVEKTEGDSWIVKAHMKYGDREFVAPIPVKVKWAGDVAVLIVDKLTIPGPGGSGGTAYSARLLIHENTYAGHWSGGDHAGLMHGVITKNAAAAPAQSK